MRFVLVHGAYHGSWCWELLIPEIELRGHAAIAVDLPIGDPSAGAAEYADVVAEAITDDAAIVVGHSMSGLVIPLVAERRRLRKLVFLCAFVPQPAVSFNQQRGQDRIEPEGELKTSEFTDLGEGVWMIGPNTATELFFHDASPDLANWAVQRLRPQAYGVMNEPSPLAEWPDIESAYILSRDDHALNAAWARRVALERLHTEAIELDGGHSPFLTRPGELAQILDTIAN